MSTMLHSILTTSYAPPAPKSTTPEPLTVHEVAAVSIRAAMWNDMSWRDHAACQDIDTNMFFPVGLTGAAIDQTQRAKTICPAQPACLEFALRTNQDHGVWGAHTEEERRALRRARRAAARRALAAERAVALERSSMTEHVIGIEHSMNEAIAG